MASILGIGSLNKSQSSSNTIVAAYGNDVINVDTGLGYGLNLIGNNVEFENFLDRSFLQDYNSVPLTFNGTDFSQEYVGRAMTSKYHKRLKSRMYLGYCKFTGPQKPQDASNTDIVFPSRVFHSDFFQGNDLTWGLEWGTNGKTIAGSPYFDLAQPLVQDFKARKIKVGDPLFITNGNAQMIAHGPYFVASIPSPHRLVMTENFPETDTSLHYWVGSNWFDVETDDNDFITWLSENDDLLLVFKQFSLYRKSASTLQRIKNAPGTTSGRSVVNIGGLTFYFHGSNTNTRKTGIYAYNGGSSKLISRAIQNEINGITAANYDNVVSWPEGTRLRMFVGDITNAAKDISITNGVMTLDTEGTQWSVEPIADVVTATGKFIESGSEKYFIGTSDDEVHEVASGNGYNTVAMPWSFEKGEFYPSTTAVLNTFTRIQVDSKNAKGVEVFYKLLGTPKDDDDQWIGLGEIQHNHQEFTIPTKHNYAKGIDLRFHEESSRVNTSLIEKVTIFHIPESTKIIK